MANRSQNSTPARRSLMRMALAVTVLTLAVFCAVVTVVTLNLRQSIRQQIVDRDADALYPFALLAMERAGASVDDLTGEADLLGVALEASELKNVLGVRLYDWKGELVEAVPPILFYGFLSARELDALQGLESVSRYYPQASLESLTFEESPVEAPDGVPVVEVLLPLHDGEAGPFLGAAQYFIDGAPVAEEFAALDRHLAWMASVAMLAGGGLIGLVMLLSFQNMSRLTHQVEERGRRLAQANADLTLAAKTSAIGTITSHFVHGLKNPLSALRMSLEMQQESGQDTDMVLESAEQMQEMIDQMVSVLRDETTGIHYELTFEELRECLMNKLEPLAEKRQVRFTVGEAPAAVIDSHRGNLLLLIAVNLVENAIQFSEPDASVRLDFTRAGERVVLTVCDEGPGLPRKIREQLFQPGCSSRPGGTGLGLALSKHLAQLIGAELELEKSDPTGTCFTVTLTPGASPVSRDLPRDLLSN